MYEHNPLIFHFLFQRYPAADCLVETPGGCHVRTISSQPLEEHQKGTCVLVTFIL